MLDICSEYELSLLFIGLLQSKSPRVLDLSPHQPQNLIPSILPASPPQPGPTALALSSDCRQQAAICAGRRPPRIRGLRERGRPQEDRDSGRRLHSREPVLRSTGLHCLWQVSDAEVQKQLHSPMVSVLSCDGTELLPQAIEGSCQQLWILGSCLVGMRMC
ncbi:Hypothetical predicted protein [Pelobates cultripes]|uniref:Uncharacterized protein n=1 Tax=Pelobates cultripes TaxID=61616 RepID=A0AAD1RD56_PELCU|nr:Hypothetical predicted protein [Pelobates cultripes]